MEAEAILELTVVWLMLLLYGAAAVAVTLGLLVGASVLLDAMLKRVQWRLKRLVYEAGGFRQLLRDRDFAQKHRWKVHHKARGKH